MRVVIQRVKDASVTVDGSVVGAIAEGLLIYFGVAKGDEDKAAEWLAEKIVKLRIFHDDEQKMNRSLRDVGASVLVVSQFTLLANLRKGNRPSWDDSAAPEEAERLYDLFVEYLRGLVPTVETGIFGAHMDVRYTNDGPVTFVLDA
ncbi:MAG TPA: D-aminoacyl-tRNA deacylase [Sphaerochaeta sp.]|nr:D-aminoacyl-tRNA deacylase [Spirochaetota bacterium]NLV60537.1 D-tyrosyl-tRNA(Tyr) deacylase [Spirochaetales bacterium]HOE84680.1 D-aminoacyl-tRNA deacylase [Sphaerochaeta sp.]HOQ94721.1 D-aminoacyl-tRNA deacylase [Sphaerochaeta sp.]HPK47453.1 D-aminoacyl-tRNA deacylase [Sphaerochaeta sp.]